MNTKVIKKVIGLLGLAVTLGVANAAYVINGDFCSVTNIQNPPAGLNSGSAAWNDLTGNNGFNPADDTNVLNYTDGSSVDSGINIAWTSSSQDTHDRRGDVGYTVDNGHEELFAGYLLSNQAVIPNVGTFPATITLSGTGILAALQAKDAGVTSYDVYMYIDGDGVNDNTGEYSATLTGGSTVYGNDTNDFIALSGGGLGNYVEATSILSGSPTTGANYVKFTGITSDDFFVTLTGLNSDSVALNGFEIVAIPEPGTLALAAIMLGSFGGLHLLRRRKK